MVTPPVCVFVCPSDSREIGDKCVKSLKYV